MSKLTPEVEAYLDRRNKWETGYYKKWEMEIGPVTVQETPDSPDELHGAKLGLALGGLGLVVVLLAKK
jgi:hypothetical protein